MLNKAMLQYIKNSQSVREKVSAAREEHIHVLIPFADTAMTL